MHRIFILFVAISFAFAEKNVQEIQTTSGQTFYISEPQTLSRVLRINIHSDKDKLTCKRISNQLFSNTISQYKLPNYHAFAQTLSYWPTQVVSASYDQIQQKMWVLLSNGDIVEAAGSEYYSMRLRESQRYSVFKERGWIDGKIYVVGSALFLWENTVLKQIALEEKIWKEKPIQIQGKILAIQQQKSQLYVLTSKNVYSVTQELKITNSSFEESNRLMKDFSSNRQCIYVLCGSSILTLSKATLKMIRNQTIQQGQWGWKIAASQRFLLVYFNKHKNSVVREFVIAEASTDLQPSIKHHSFQTVTQIMIFKDYGLVFQNYQISVFQLNLLYPDFISKNIITLKYEHLLSVGKISFYDIGLLLISSGQVRVAELRNILKGLPIFGGKIICSTEEKGEVNLRINYDGLCSQNGTKLCKEQKRFLVKTEQNTNNEWLLTLQATIIVIVISGVIVCLSLYLFQKRRLVKEIDHRKSLLRKRKSMQSKSEITENIIYADISPEKSVEIKALPQEK